MYSQPLVSFHSETCFKPSFSISLTGEDEVLVTMLLKDFLLEVDDRLLYKFIELNILDNSTIIISDNYDTLFTYKYNSNCDTSLSTKITQLLYKSSISHEEYMEHSELEVSLRFRSKIIYEFNSIVISSTFNSTVCSSAFNSIVSSSTLINNKNINNSSKREYSTLSTYPISTDMFSELKAFLSSNNYEVSPDIQIKIEKYLKDFKIKSNKNSSG